MNGMNVRRVDFRARRLGGILALFLVAVTARGAAGQSCGGFKVLVFSKTAGFRHAAQITAGVALVQALGAANGFAVDATEDAGRFTPANLARYAVVVFLNTTGDVLSPAQETALQAFILRGGGFVGVHSAADTEYGWPFYGLLVGAYFQSHPAVQSADVHVIDHNHLSTAHLPAKFSHADEWYDFRTNPAANPNIRVLLTVDERTYQGGTMGAVHPVAWCQASVGAGRSWYTALGHTVATYAAPFFQQHLLGGILFASRATRTPLITATQTYGAASGTPRLGLAARPRPPSLVDLVLSNGSPGGTGILCVSTCSASWVVPPYTILVDLGPTHWLGHAPLTLDQTGQFVLPVPLRLSLPAYVGTTLFVQGGQSWPTVGLSNGLSILLTP